MIDRKIVGYPSKKCLRGAGLGFVISLAFSNFTLFFQMRGPSWSFGSWIYNYMCDKCLSPLTLWVRIPLMYSIHDYVLKFVSAWRQVGGILRCPPPVKLTATIKLKKLLKVALNTIILTLILNVCIYKIWAKVLSRKKIWSLSGQRFISKINKLFDLEIKVRASWPYFSAIS